MSGIEIISLTPKGEALSHSVRSGNSSDWRVKMGWAVIHFVKRVGSRTTFDKICSFVFGGDVARTRTVITYLKSKGIVVGE
jgi:hypothetical protein